MSAPVPITYEYDGEAMIPLPRFQRFCDRQYVAGKHYTLLDHEERSQASHNFYFASVAEAWKNLHEDAAERFPTPDSLRKYALIKTGYRDEKSIGLASHAEALRVAAFIRPLDEFAIVTVTGSVVTQYTAKSQSRKAMGDKETFEASKQAVLEFLADMIGVEPAALSANAGRAA